MANYIVFDLEFTVSAKRQRAKMDIVQIGAVKLTDSEDGPVMIDTFQRYVRPSNGLLPNAETLAFLNITAQEFKDPVSFPEMIAQFRDWLGTEAYFLCTWGDDDRQRIVEHCLTYHLALDWFCNFNDIQLAFTRLHGKDRGQRFGLKKALDEVKIPFIGQVHHALDDAFNTAKLFRWMFAKIALVEKPYVEEPLTATEVVYQTDNEPNLAFAKFADAMKGMFAS